MIYTILIEKGGDIIAVQETFESLDDAIGDVVDYDYTPHAIMELGSDAYAQTYIGDVLECCISQYLEDQQLEFRV